MPNAAYITKSPGIANDDANQIPFLDSEKVPGLPRPQIPFQHGQGGKPGQQRLCHVRCVVTENLNDSEICASRGHDADSAGSGSSSTGMECSARNGFLHW